MQGLVGYCIDSSIKKNISHDVGCKRAQNDHCHLETPSPGPSGRDLGLPPKLEIFSKDNKDVIERTIISPELRMVSLETGYFSSSVMLASVAGVESHIG